MNYGFPLWIEIACCVNNCIRSDTWTLKTGIQKIPGLQIQAGDISLGVITPLKVG